MKSIEKREPEFYFEFVKKNKPKEWNDLSSKIGLKCREYMLQNEQSSQCAYTEKNIAPQDAHIDHFIKQSFLKRNLFSVSEFNWNNLFTSCNDENVGAKYKDKNIQKEDYKEIINLVKDNCAECFEYKDNGRIEPKNGNIRVRKTIDIFNLNDRSLIEQRKEVAQAVKSMDDQLSLDEVINCFGKFESWVRATYSEKDKNN